MSDFSVHIRTPTFSIGLKLLTLHRAALLRLALLALSATRIAGIFSLSLSKSRHRLLEIVFSEIAPLVNYQVDTLGTSWEEVVL